MNCLAHIIKYILYVFNIIFVICGILLIILGSLMVSNAGDFLSTIDGINADTVPILIIILGCIVFIISFFGCCGAIRESVRCTMVYAVFMFILFALQLALVIWAFVQYSKFINIMSDAVHKAFEKNDEAMDVLQIGFNCCGVKNYMDYTNRPVPPSCCGLTSGNCPLSEYVTKPGCHDAFVNFWSTNMNIIRYAGLVVALVELVAFTFACCLISSIRKSTNRI